MEKKKDSQLHQTSKRAKLRSRAEEILDSGSADVKNKMTADQVTELVHDLETHRIELELQNEDLRKTQGELVVALDQYSELYDCAPIGYLSTGKAGIITRCNLTFASILGQPRRFLINKNLATFIARDSHEDYYLHQHEACSTLLKQSCELSLTTKSGGTVWVRLDSIAVDNLASEPIEIRSMFSDITEHRLAEEELRKLSRALEFSSSAVIITNLDGEIEYVNPKFSEITGYSKEEAVGRNPSFLQSKDTSPSVRTELWETVSGGGEWRGEMYNRKKDGSFYWARDSISSVKDPKGKITHYIDIQDDVTHEYKLTEQLSYQATHDALTGLINRREFERRAERLLSTIEPGKPEHAMCFLDLDQFKVINDTCGHLAGDELLRQISRVLESAVRHRDTLGRLGGDEFGVLMEHCTAEQANRVAIALKQSIQDYLFHWKGKSFQLGVSIGLVSITESIFGLSELLSQADAACYIAKDMGRNRIHKFRYEDLEIAIRHGEMQWVSRINQALKENRFCLYAQIIAPLGDGDAIPHYELLLRMLDEAGDTVLPAAFMAAAERYNLVGKLDFWVIENAFALIAKHADFIHHSGVISINLSGQSLNDDDFLDFITTQLQALEIDADKICFEITETAAIANVHTAINFMSQLKLLGCRFALDDFGSGLSSFAYLKSLPVDYIKIDGVFVKDIATNEIDYAMVKSINEIGQVMGMQTIAEFVESDEIKNLLQAIGVNYAQGSAMGKTLPFREVIENFK